MQAGCLRAQSVRRERRAELDRNRRAEYFFAPIRLMGGFLVPCGPTMSCQGACVAKIVATNRSSFWQRDANIFAHFSVAREWWGVSQKPSPSGWFLKGTAKKARPFGDRHSETGQSFVDLPYGQSLQRCHGFLLEVCSNFVEKVSTESTPVLREPLNRFGTQFSLHRRIAGA